jgi:hypothetical protein
MEKFTNIILLLDLFVFFTMEWKKLAFENDLNNIIFYYNSWFIFTLKSLSNQWQEFSVFTFIGNNLIFLFFS